MEYLQLTAVNYTLIKVDTKTGNLRIAIEDSNLDCALISKTFNDLHGSIHSINQVISGKRIAEAFETHQDRSRNAFFYDNSNRILLFSNNLMQDTIN